MRPIFCTVSEIFRQSSFVEESSTRSRIVRPERVDRDGVSLLRARVRVSHKTLLREKISSNSTDDPTKVRQYTHITSSNTRVYLILFSPPFFYSFPSFFFICKNALPDFVADGTLKVHARTFVLSYNYASIRHLCLSFSLTFSLSLPPSHSLFFPRVPLFLIAIN